MFNEAGRRSHVVLTPWATWTSTSEIHDEAAAYHPVALSPVSNQLLQLPLVDFAGCRARLLLQLQMTFSIAGQA